MGQGSQPLVKWTGGKRFLTTILTELLPEKRGRYFEPFCGGAAFFFALQPEKATLSDTNEELINAYKVVRDDPTELYAAAKKLRNGKETYYEVRKSSPSTDIERAVRFLYLCQLSFNGIYRVNLKGEFNVPYGYKTSVIPFREDHILRCSKILANAELLVSDFAEVTSQAVADDVVYFDPPYTVMHSNNGFVKYNAKLFSWEDQKRLAVEAQRLADLGAKVIVSNARHKSISDLYPKFDEVVVERHSVIAASGAKRGQIEESLFVSRKK